MGHVMGMALALLPSVKETHFGGVGTAKCLPEALLGKSVDANSALDSRSARPLFVHPNRYRFGLKNGCALWHYQLDRSEAIRSEGQYRRLCGVRRRANRTSADECRRQNTLGPRVSSFLFMFRQSHDSAFENHGEILASIPAKSAFKPSAPAWPSV